MEMTDEELRAKLEKLLAVDPQEIGGRAGEVAPLIAEILNLRRWKKALINERNEFEQQLYGKPTQ